MQLDIENSPNLDRPGIACEICYEDDPTVKLTRLQGCQHAFCADCFKDYYQSMVQEQNKHHMLGCPQHGCEVKPTIEEIREIVGEECFEKYERFKENREVALNPDLFFCSKPGCGVVLSAKDQQDKGVACPKCSTHTCSECKNLHHPGKTCDQGLDRDFAEFTKEMGVNVHQCPRCKSPVEKDGGCPMMKCSICGYCWCWSCGWPPNHFFHHYVFDGFFCHFTNEMIFGFDSSLAPWCRLTLAFLFVLFSPLIVLVVGAFHLSVSSIESCNDESYGCFWFIYKIKYSTSLSKPVRFVLLFFAYLLTFLQCLVMVIFIIAFVAAAIVLGVVPTIALVIVFLIRLMIQWCPRSRMVHISSLDPAEIQKIEEVRAQGRTSFSRPGAFQISSSSSSDSEGQNQLVDIEQMAIKLAAQDESPKPKRYSLPGPVLPALLPVDEAKENLTREKLHLGFLLKSIESARTKPQGRKSKPEADDSDEYGDSESMSQSSSMSSTVKSPERQDGVKSPNLRPSLPDASALKQNTQQKPVNQTKTARLILARTMRKSRSQIIFIPEDQLSEWSSALDLSIDS